MRLLYVPLPESVRAALCDVAVHEMRRPQDQAALFIVEALREKGSLKDEAPAATGA